MIPTHLNLVPASFELIDAAIDDEAELGRLLDATIANGWPGFPEALPVLRDACARNREPQAWGSFLFVLDDPRTLVGHGGYKGAPSGEGVVEIGYAIAPVFQRRGLATEAVRQLVARAFAEPRVRFVDAHTLAEPNASTRVLQRSGFEMVRAIEDPDDGALWHWRLKRREAAEKRAESLAR